MLAVHSRLVHSTRFSSEGYLRRDCASVIFLTLAVSSQSTRECGLEKNYQKSEATARRDTRFFDLGIADC